MSFQRKSRVMLHREIAACWDQGRIAVSKNILPETFLGEVDQVACQLGVKVETRVMDGKCYAMANDGMPLGLQKDSEAGHKYRQINPQYRINQTAWARITEGLGL